MPPDDHEHNPIIRSLWALDRDAIRGHFLRLDPETRKARFAGELSDEAVVNYARDILHFDSVVLGAFVDGKLRGIAELRGFLGNWPVTAEAAFSVEHDWQNRGIGEALFDHILAAAQNRGVKTLSMICLRENTRMKHLAQKHDANLHYEPGAIEATLDPHWPTPVSILREVTKETRGIAQSMWHWPDTGS